MAGTCPGCGIRISGHLCTCPGCGSHCLIHQDTCPQCGAPLENKPAPSPEPSPEEETPKKAPRKRKRIWKWLACAIVAALLLGALGAGGDYYHQQLLQQREQARYERLCETTNPDFYQQFLDEYPESEHCDEVRERMLRLQEEAREWQQVRQAVNRVSIISFMQKYPGSVRLRICEDMIDSIDWQEAQAVGSEEAITAYLTQHPAGRYADCAAETKNALRLSKVTTGERALIRGALETFFSKAIANRDIKAASQAIDSTMVMFCGKKDADAEAIIQYASEKKAKDVIGLHYLIDQKMSAHKEMLAGGVVCYSVEFEMLETISRSDISQPASCNYRVTALISEEYKIVQMEITKL